MQAIQVEGEGRDAKLVLGECPAPTLAEGEVRIRVAATAVNRADLMQRRGLYPPPPGAPATLGLECAGTILEVADLSCGLSPGDCVMALLPGGGYASEVCAHAGSVMRVPEGMELTSAAGVPEVFLTSYLNLFMLAQMPDGGAALVQGGGSGIGTSATQLLLRADARVIVTAGSDEKCNHCRALGAHVAINYRNGDFADAVLEATEGQGVDVAFDSIGAPYLESHLRCLKVGGRLVLIGLMGGAKAEINLGLVLAKRLTLIGSTLRSRPVEEKAEIVRSFEARFGADLASGAIRPIIDTVMPLAEAQAAHDRLEASDHFGKIVLEVGA